MQEVMKLVLYDAPEGERKLDRIRREREEKEAQDDE
jgi:hypothetical protein